MQPDTRKWIIGISVALVVILFASFSTVEIMIGSGVKRFTQHAQEYFPGDRVAALTAMVDCESCAMNDRNHAVWALGQLADPCALPVLEKYYTGEQCDHLHMICQYELKKALRRVRGGNNPEVVFWKWMLPEEE